MNKKILIGSIIAVAILIGVSFTSVVGYNSVTSDVKASPLFTIRTSRAIDRESKDLTCDYVGKGRGTVIPIPMRDNKNIQIHKVIKTIREMDETSLNRFMVLIINRMYDSNIYENKDKTEIINLFHYLKDNPVVLEKYVGDFREIDDYLSGSLTVDGNWRSGCGILIVLASLFGFAWTISIVLLWTFYFLGVYTPIIELVYYALGIIALYLIFSILPPTSLPTCDCFP